MVLPSLSGSRGQVDEGSEEGSLEQEGMQTVQPGICVLSTSLHPAVSLSRDLRIAETKEASPPRIGAPPQGFHRHEVEEALPPGAAAARQPVWRLELATAERRKVPAMRLV